MSEDLTQNLPSRPFEERVLAEFAALNARFDSLDARVASLDTRVASLEERMTSLEGRMASLEEIVDARLRETRPIWEGVLQRLTDLEASLGKLNRQFKLYVQDAFELRSRVEKLEDDRYPL
jgi:chromosome segregation ATPase